MTFPLLIFDHDADAIYIRFSDLLYAFGEGIDRERRIDYAAGGEPIGIELPCMSEGVDTSNLPCEAQVAVLLEQYNIRVTPRTDAHC